MTMQTKPALHRVQDLDSEMAAYYARKEFKADISAYLHLRELQLDAQEDEDYHLAKSIGRSMRDIREKYEWEQWDKQIRLQDH